MYAIEHLPAVAWTTPDSYGGFNPVGDYLILSRHRDSDLVSESNWYVACELLGAVDHDTADMESRPAVYTFRAGHWAFGWVEYLLVRPDAPDAMLQEAGEIICSLSDYPILSDEDHSEREYHATCAAWASASVADRVSYLQRAGLPIWSARRDVLPNDPTGILCEKLLGY